MSKAVVIFAGPAKWCRFYSERKKRMGFWKEEMERRDAREPRIDVHGDEWVVVEAKAPYLTCAAEQKGGCTTRIEPGTLFMRSLADGTLMHRECFERNNEIDRLIARDD